ncbi:MAG: thymidine phosphorylase [Candidatus Eisenbacteria bacterium]|nr:thymidine phosphorylase [Candidatus Eisenbacteria bacterium]
MSADGFDVRELIRAKRDRRAHAPDQIRAFVAGFARGDVPDYQVSAWLMAAFLNGLDAAETDALTEGLLGSGRRFDWSALGRPTADKHSTGGVGDKVSLILAPVAAACGVLVPMVSGRGLGHTGGTLDKLESIPGFRTRLSPEAIRAQLDRVGVVMVGQGPDLAPADGKLYALRDVTGTVERDYFIVPSIVSKKIAEGAGAIAYDVKCGNGAFMKDPGAARALALRLVATTRALGAKAAALVTDMSQPLGEAVGNALEVREAVALLRGGGPSDVRALTLDLAALMLRDAGVAADVGAGRAAAERALASGAAWERFTAMVEAQGGDAKVLDRADGLPSAPVRVTVAAPRSGAIAAIDTFAIGERVVAIGGGRRAAADAVDPRVGMIVRARLGDTVRAGEPLAELHTVREDAESALRIAACFTIADTAPAAPALVIERID